MSGWLSAANGGPEQHLSFNGTLNEQALELHWELPRSKITGVLVLLRAAVPEAGRATTLGHFSVAGTLSLPSGKWSTSSAATPTGCRNCVMAAASHRAGRAPDQMGRALPQAVLTAEDGHFYEHPGYDLDELAPHLADVERNGKRGASSLSQQLAKNLYTGADRNGAASCGNYCMRWKWSEPWASGAFLPFTSTPWTGGPGICGAAAQRTSTSPARRNSSIRYRPRGSATFCAIRTAPTARSS